MDVQERERAVTKLQDRVNSLDTSELNELQEAEKATVVENKELVVYNSALDRQVALSKVPAVRHSKWDDASEHYDTGRTPLNRREALNLVRGFAVARMAYGNPSEHYWNNIDDISNNYDFDAVKATEEAHAMGADLNFNFEADMEKMELIVETFKSSGFKNVQLKDGAIVDRKSGLHCIILKDLNNPNRVSIGFGGTMSGNSKEMLANQVWADGLQFLGHVPTIYKEADIIVKLVSKMCPNETIEVSGHSLGGGLAQYATLRNQSKKPDAIPRIFAYCYDAAALGSGAQNKIGKSRIKKAPAVVRHLSISGDPVSDFPGIETADRFLSKVGFKTSGNFGKRFYLDPDPKRSYLSRHTDMQGICLEFFSKTALSEMPAAAPTA